MLIGSGNTARRGIAPYYLCIYCLSHCANKHHQDFDLLEHLIVIILSKTPSNKTSSCSNIRLDHPPYPQFLHRVLPHPLDLCLCRPPHYPYHPHPLHPGGQTRIHRHRGQVLLAGIAAAPLLFEPRKVHPDLSPPGGHMPAGICPIWISCFKS